MQLQEIALLWFETCRMHLLSCPLEIQCMVIFLGGGINPFIPLWIRPCLPVDYIGTVYRTAKRTTDQNVKVSMLLLGPTGLRRVLINVSYCVWALWAKVCVLFYTV